MPHIEGDGGGDTVGCLVQFSAKFNFQFLRLVFPNLFHSLEPFSTNKTGLELVSSTYFKGGKLVKSPEVPRLPRQIGLAAPMAPLETHLVVLGLCHRLP